MHVRIGEQWSAETGQRHDDVGWCARFEPNESGRRYTDDRKRLACQIDVLTDNSGVGAELPLPVAVTQNCDVSISRRLIVRFGDGSPEDGAHAKKAETVSAGEHSFGELRFP